MPHVRALVQPQRPLLIIAMVAAAVFAGLTILSNKPSALPFDQRCESWDEAASAALAFMVQERDEITEAYLGDAVFRLRRARKNCRYGLVALARIDYDVLRGERRKFGR